MWYAKPTKKRRRRRKPNRKKRKSESIRNRCDSKVFLPFRINCNDVGLEDGLICARVAPWEWVIGRVGGEEIEQQSQREQGSKNHIVKSIMKQNHTKIIATHINYEVKKQNTRTSPSTTATRSAALCGSHWNSSGAQNVVFIFEAEKIFAKRWLSCKHYIYNHYRYNWLWSGPLDRSERLNDLYSVRCLNIPKSGSSLRAIAIYYGIFALRVHRTNELYWVWLFSLTRLDLTVAVCFFLSLAISLLMISFNIATLSHPFPLARTLTLCVSPSLPLVLSLSLSFGSPVRFLTCFNRNGYGPNLQTVHMPKDDVQQTKDRGFALCTHNKPTNRIINALCVYFIEFRRKQASFEFQRQTYAAATTTTTRTSLRKSIES